MNPTQVCTKCGERRYFYNFQFRKDTQKYRNICKICRSKQEAERRDRGDAKPYKTTKEQNFKYSIKQLYDLTIEAYEIMFIECGGMCSICGNETKLVIDHCHKTGYVRGLICQHCNFMLGNANDNIDILKAGIEYLTRHHP